MMAKNISKRLKRLRKETGDSQAELAARLGVQQSTVSRWERGSSTPAGLYLATLNKLFDDVTGDA